MKSSKIIVLAAITAVAAVPASGQRVRGAESFVRHPALGAKVARAKATALRKARGVEVYDPTSRDWSWVPDECSRLFDELLGDRTGYELIRKELDLRYGQNAHFDPDGDGPRPSYRPCATPSVRLWTTCCGREAAVYVCDAFGSSAVSESDAWAFILHEALHTAGLPENPTYRPGVGSAEDPTPWEVQSSVEAACAESGRRVETEGAVG